MTKALFALPFLALGVIAAKAAPIVPPPSVIAAPAAVVADPANQLILDLSNGAHIVVQLRPDLAPAHVQRIQQLVSQHFYDNLTFHRVIPGFMAQGGDPKGTGEGGSPLPDLKAEFNAMPHLRGVVSMARADAPDSANSQFFIMLAPKFSLDHKYTAFGRVISGMDGVDKIAVGEPPATPTRIVHAALGGPVTTAPVAAVAAPVAPPTDAAPIAPAPATPPVETPPGQ